MCRNRLPFVRNASCTKPYCGCTKDVLFMKEEQLMGYQSVSFYRSIRGNLFIWLQQTRHMVIDHAKSESAFSLQCQFSPWSESSNRAVATSFPKTFAPGNFRSLDRSLPGTLPGKNRLLGSTSACFRSLKRKSNVMKALK